MPKKPPPALIAGPYRAPRCKPGQPLYDVIRGDIVVDAISDAPIPWPIGRERPNVRAVPILTGDLVRAVRTESVQAVAHYWGVSDWTARRWRRSLGVPRFNEGTQALWSELTAERIPLEARRRGGHACPPEARRRGGLARRRGRG